MPYEENDDLARAIAALDIFMVWRVAYRDGVIALPPPQGDGVVKSPFREDGAKGSFSILGQGRGWRDHGGNGDHGGVKDFVIRCWPSESPGERAVRMIEMSGIIKTPARQIAHPAAGAPGAVDPALARAAKSIEKRRRSQELEDAIYEEHRKKLLPPVFKPGPLWPACVATRWEEGVANLAGDNARMGELAKARGWPVEWVAELANMGLIGYPYERMATPGAKYAARQKAFLVQQPRLTGEVCVLDPVGYHQHWFVPPRNGEPAKKGWLYLPSIPKKEPRSQYERALLAYGAGATLEAGRALVQPLPFVIGDLQNPWLIVILEGQWDAITFYGACGNFHDTAMPERVAVFGIRGAQGLDVFLGAWALWLRRHRPRAWVIADNDAAGGTWRDQPPAEPGLPRPPSLGDRLIAAGCRGGERDEAAAPVISWLKKGNWGKDFNDYFKAFNGKLGPEKMAAWMHSLGITIAGGRA